jgi:CheY-like chemotaxis protein
VVSCVLHTLRSTAGELGAVDYLVKPVTQAQLRSALGRLVRLPKSALVVDDDPEMSRLLSRMIRSLSPGCQIAAAEDGARALELLREMRPDVVLLDLLMPSVDGYAVLETMRGDPQLRSVPVLVVTARGLQDETTVASTLSLSREGGLTVAEVMRWLTGGLEALLQLGSSAPAPPSGPAE